MTMTRTPMATAARIFGQNRQHALQATTPTPTAATRIDAVRNKLVQQLG